MKPTLWMGVRRCLVGITLSLKLILGIFLLLANLEAWKSFPIPEERLCSHFPQIPESDSIHHMSHSQMRPELPPLPASANEEPSALYQVCSLGCCYSTDIGGRQTARLDEWDQWLWSLLPPEKAMVVWGERAI